MSKIASPRLRLCLTVVAAVCLTVVAGDRCFAGTPAYGVTYFDQGYCGAPGVEIENKKRLTYNHAFDATGTDGAVCSIHGTINNGKVYGYAGALAGESSAYAGMDAYFFDTFSISGPSGQSGQFSVTMTLNGIVNNECGAGCEVGDLIDTFNLLENGTVIPGQEYSGIIATLYAGSKQHQTMTVTITLEADTTVVLGEMLQFRDLVSGGGGQITLTGPHDMQQVGSITVAPVTAGFSFTTASGLTYSAAEEPADGGN